MRSLPLLLIALFAACAAPSPRISPVSAGDAPDKVQNTLGQPNSKFARRTNDLDLEIWSYERPYNFWSLDDCAGFVEKPMLVNGKPVEGRKCRERARVIFAGGKVAAFEERTEP